MNLLILALPMAMHRSLEADRLTDWVLPVEYMYSYTRYLQMFYCLLCFCYQTSVERTQHLIIIRLKLILCL